MTWAVRGMSCDPSTVNIDEYIDSNVTVMENIATLVNTGGYSISDITTRVLLDFVYGD